MKNIYFLIALILSISLFGQDMEGDSTYTSYHDSGEKFLEINFKNGNKHGVYKRFCECGKLEVEGLYNNGIQNGVWKSYYGWFSPRSENGNTCNGKREHAGHLKNEVPYKMGVIHGLVKSYDYRINKDYPPRFIDTAINYNYYSEFLEKEVNYINGTPMEIQEFSTLITVKDLDTEEYDYQNDKNYEIIGYSDQKRLKSKVTLNEKNEWDGDYIEYHHLDSPYTNVKIKSTYIDGKLEGKRTEYFNNGKINSEYNYTDGIFNGDFNIYSFSGEMRFEADIDPNIGSGTNYYLVRKGNFVDGDQQGQNLEYHGNGKLKEKSNYLDGKLHGEIHKYTKDGYLIEHGQYANGLKDGYFEESYYDGQLKQQAFYINDTLDGSLKSYYENGNRYEDFNYVNGKKDGIQKEYFDNGILYYLDKHIDGKSERLQSFYNNGTKNIETLFDAQEKIVSRRFWNAYNILEHEELFTHRNDTIFSESDIWFHEKSGMPLRHYEYLIKPSGKKLMTRKMYFSDGSGILFQSSKSFNDQYYLLGYYKSGEIHYSGFQKTYNHDAYSQSEESIFRNEKTEWYRNRLSANLVRFIQSDSDNGIKVNYYDLKPLIKIFLKDLFIHNRMYGSPSELVNKLEKNKEEIFENITATFETLEGTTIALSSGLGQDDKIIIKIDPENWQKASLEKRWYILYHELGHDVLNLDHGEGGKMMFNFVDKDYTLEEFVEDRDYMFKSFLGVEQ